MKKKLTKEEKFILALVKGIKKQQREIRKCNYDPEWSLFENTFGWFQIKKSLTQDLQEVYKEIWEKVYKGEL